MRTVRSGRQALKYRVTAAMVGALVATMAAAGCGSGANTKAGKPNGTQPPTGTAPTGGHGHRVTFISGNLGIPYYIGMQCAMQHEADRLGVKFSIVGPGNFDPTLQIPLVNAVDAKKPDGVIIAPTDANALRAPLQQMVNRGIKVVQVDTSVKDPGFVSASLTSDNHNAGVQLAGMFVKLVSQMQGRKSGPVLLMDNSPGASATFQRGNGIMDELKKHPQFKVDREFDHNQASKDTSIASAFISAHPDVVGVLTVYDLGVVGALPALKSSGLLGKIPVVTFDSDPVVVRQLRANKIQATMTQQIGKMGKLSVQYMVDALDGKTPKTLTELPMVPITHEDVDSPKAQALYYPAKYDPTQCQ